MTLVFLSECACAAGVYVGCMYSEYTQLQYNLGYKISPGLVTGNGISYLVGRVSYTFGLQGGWRLGEAGLACVEGRDMDALVWPKSLMIDLK